MSSPNIPFVLKLSLPTTTRFSGETDGQGAAAANMSTKRKLIKLFGEVIEVVEDSADDAVAAVSSNKTKEIVLFGRVIAIVNDNAVHEADDKSSSGLVGTVNKSADPHESEASNVSNNGPGQLKRQNPSPEAGNARAKRPRIKAESHVDLEAAWPYRKKLQYSDVDGSSRFLFSKEYVRASVLKSRNERLVQACQTRNGTEVVVRDEDTETEHTLILKSWATTSFVLTSNWSEKFVKRRGLEAGDLVGLRWDEDGSMFHFKLLEKAAASANQQN